ncbi:MAG: hypothetical protein JOS17DRAFT_690959, partial [Linnemannia elongata]
PDLDIIEHVWGYIMYRLTQYEQATGSMDRFWGTHVQDIWTYIPSTYLQELYESMPRRTRDLLRNKGVHIKYR